MGNRAIQHAKRRIGDQSPTASRSRHKISADDRLHGQFFRVSLGVGVEQPAVMAAITSAVAAFANLAMGSAAVLSSWRFIGDA
jgi:hypothetical protein